MCLKAVTNSQLNGFSTNPKALDKFLISSSDPRAMIAKMLGRKAIEHPALAEFGKVYGGEQGLQENACIQESSPQTDLSMVWHGLHWIFTGSAYEGDEPLCYLLHKGLVLGQYRESIVRGISSKQLAAFEAEVARFDDAELRRRYDGAAMAAADLYLSDMWQGDKEEGIDALKTWLERLQVFLKEAKARNEGMIIWTT